MYLALVCLGNKGFRVAIMIFATFMLARFIQADLVRQSVLLRGQQHDLALANRILARIEQLPGIDFGNKYDLVRVGNYPNFRWRIMTSKGHKFDLPSSSHMDSGNI